MQASRIAKISEALCSYSASDLTAQILSDISVKELFEVLALQGKAFEKTAFRAAWALEHLLLQDKTLLLAQQHQVLQTFLSSGNWSAQRSLTKLVYFLLKHYILAAPVLSEEQEEQIISKIMDMLETTECPISVRANLYDLLYIFVEKHPWLGRELALQITLDLEKKNAVALYARGNKILKQLKVIR